MTGSVEWELGVLEEMGWGVWRGDWGLVLVPVLMLADYYMTLWAASMFGKDEASRAAYEMNPLHRGAIGRLQMVNPLHLAGVCVVTGLVFGSAFMDAWFYRLVLGILVGGFGFIVGRHVGNIAMMRLARTPRGQVRGVATRTRGFLLEVTAQQTLAFAFAPLLFILVLEPSFFMAGVLAGVVVVGLSPLQWLKQLDAAARAEPVRLGQNACGFCGADAATAGRLITGDAAVICDACVETCVEALREAEAPATAAA